MKFKFITVLVVSLVRSLVRSLPTMDYLYRPIKNYLARRYGKRVSKIVEVSLDYKKLTSAIINDASRKFEENGEDKGKCGLKALYIYKEFNERNIFISVEDLCDLQPFDGTIVYKELYKRIPERNSVILNRELFIKKIKYGFMSFKISPEHQKLYFKFIINMCNISLNFSRYKIIVSIYCLCMNVEDLQNKSKTIRRFINKHTGYDVHIPYMRRIIANSLIFIPIFAKHNVCFPLCRQEI